MLKTIFLIIALFIAFALDLEFFETFSAITFIGVILLIYLIYLVKKLINKLDESKPEDDKKE